MQAGTVPDSRAPAGADQNLPLRRDADGASREARLIGGEPNALTTRACDMPLAGGPRDAPWVHKHRHGFTTEMKSSPLAEKVHGFIVQFTENGLFC